MRKTMKINVCLGVVFSLKLLTYNHQVSLHGNGSVKLINFYSLRKANEMRTGIRGRPGSTGDNPIWQ